MRRHRGDKQEDRYERSLPIILLSPAFLLFVDQ